MVKKKGFIGKLLDNLDKKMEQKARAGKCCCCDDGCSKK